MDDVSHSKTIFSRQHRHHSCNNVLIHNRKIQQECIIFGFYSSMIFIYLLRILFTLTKFKSWDFTEQLIDWTCRPEKWLGGKLFQIDIFCVLPRCHAGIKKNIFLTECIATKGTVKLVEIYWWNAGTISLTPASNDQLNTDTGRILNVRS
jgi:hypothetical protein